MRSAIYRDPGWTDFDDLWGIGFGTCSTGIAENPRPKPDIREYEPVTETVVERRRRQRELETGEPQRKFKLRPPADATRVLLQHGIWLSDNPKTILCLSKPQVGKYGTCRPSDWCEKYCYGWSVRCQDTKAMEKSVSNALFFQSMPRLPRSVISDIAWAIREVAASVSPGGIDAMRWNGIGDLVPNEIPLLDELTADGSFVIYTFTRKPNVLERLPVRDNLVIWCSIDNTMSSRRVDEALRATDMHGTGLVFASEIGLRCGSKALEPPFHAQPSVGQSTHGIDPRLQEYLDAGLHFETVFGYHGSGRTTRALVNQNNEPLDGPECPGTDPFGGGHFLGTCLMCGWCLRKPGKAGRPRTLQQNRKRWVDADSFIGRDYGEIWLDDGRRR